MSGGSLQSWALPPARLTLAVDDVHVWQASLCVPESTLARLYSTLSPDEQERAARYHFLRDRQRFIAARGWLRSILSMYLSAAAGALHFRYGLHGKPELDVAGESAPGGLQFNMAHCDDVALCAVSRGRKVGVDVEHIRPGFADAALAESFFAPREVAALRSLPALDRERAFFACWTRKEAYLKARGEGLMMPLDEFEVSFAPGDTPAVQRTTAGPPDSAPWSLRELDLGPGYVAALAVEGQGWRPWLWQDPRHG